MPITAKMLRIRPFRKKMLHVAFREEKIPVTTSYIKMNNMSKDSVERRNINGKVAIRK